MGLTETLRVSLIVTGSRDCSNGKATNAVFPGILGLSDIRASGLAVTEVFCLQIKNRISWRGISVLVLC